MLPFQNDGKKKYQCFCCGIQFTDFSDFTNHIKENHDEGRDYLICEICGACVRDLPLHHKKHLPHFPMPKYKMLRALIWKDISPKGEKKTRKPKFREGWYESTKMKKKFYYRSGYESKVFECLDSWNECVAFEAEPFRIPYLWEGTSHEYTPDILVIFIDGHKELWEIKPANQTALEQNQCKWSAAAEACEPRGWKFVVKTEQGIKQLEIKVRNQISSSSSS